MVVVYIKVCPPDSNPFTVLYGPFEDYIAAAKWVQGLTADFTADWTKVTFRVLCSP